MIRSLFLVGLAAAEAGFKDFGTFVFNFDPKCSRDSESTLVDYIVDRVDRSARSSALQLSSIKLRALLEGEIESERQIIESQVNMNLRREAAERQGQSLKNNEVALTKRTLGETPRVQREDEILSALHLMAVAAIGGDRVTELLAAERNGDVAGMMDIITESNPLGLTSEEIGGLVRATRSSSKQFVTKVKSLEFVELKIVRNPVLGERLMDYAELLPCLENKPEPDYLFDSEPLVIEETEDVAEGSNRDITSFVDIVTPDAMKLRLAEEAKTGEMSDAGKLNETIWLELPNEGTGRLWQLFTQVEDQGYRYGVGADSAWATFARDFELTRNPDYANNNTLNLSFKEMMKDMASHYPPVEIAVIDTGCSRHVDLVHQFWRNYETPGCTDETFAGEGGDEDWPGNCVGYDFGSELADPTINSKNSHGTIVSACAAAEADNGKGVIGICPWCKVVCLKIADANGKMSIARSVAALDYVMAKGIKIVNCSFGHYGLGVSMEDKAFWMATKSGVLVTASAGNLACNTDLTANDCMGPWEQHLPSGYGFRGLMSIGGSAKMGRIYSKSNYGVTSVTAFSPGEQITVVNGLDQTATASGTSLAAPIAAGVAGIVWTKYPNLTNVEIEEILVKSAIPSPDLKDKARVGGIVAAHRALAYAELKYGN